MFETHPCMCALDTLEGFFFFYITAHKFVRQGRDTNKHSARRTTHTAGSDAVIRAVRAQ